LEKGKERNKLKRGGGREANHFQETIGGKLLADKELESVCWKVGNNLFFKRG